ncbi:WW domain-binding protein 2-like isoform X1 [Apteryx mantelli]|uniref:WW domain-binding protein 2-like isoform X1 n=1 Tax=Apteryx mantelli TaxID=2696672 RepID=A0A8B7K1D9_9AVES
MEVTRYQFSRASRVALERVLAHFSNVLLVLEGATDFPEELRGARRGLLYLTQYKIIFHHKAKGSTTIRFPLQLLGACAIGEEPNTKQQHIKGTITSIHGVLTFKFIFFYGANACLSLIQDLCSSDTLREAVNLQQYPTASIFSYAHPSAPPAQRPFGMLPCWPPPYPGPPEAPPPYSEVDAASPRGLSQQDTDLAASPAAPSHTPQHMDSI